jgi:hypothetical protein
MLETAAAAHDDGTAPDVALTALCDARSTLSEAGLTAAEVLYGDDDLSCPG